jgi:predicted negative regulator of RcsB-dependent stress response
MSPIEIIILIVIILFVVGVFGWRFYKVFIKKESSECACCKSNMNRAIKKAKKALSKTNCNCNK